MYETSILQIKLFYIHDNRLEDCYDQVIYPQEDEKSWRYSKNL